ncbi:MAG: hypothetical protein KAV82_14790, partial [Phycisphaerae bacterium]|nr:hypothetical protein [Phycisphaerae bacterium]
MSCHKATLGVFVLLATLLAPSATPAQSVGSPRPVCREFPSPGKIAVASDRSDVSVGSDACRGGVMIADRVGGGRALMSNIELSQVGFALFGPENRRYKFVVDYRITNTSPDQAITDLWFKITELRSTYTLGLDLDSSADWYNGLETYMNATGQSFEDDIEWVIGWWTQPDWCDRCAIPENHCTCSPPPEIDVRLTDGPTPAFPAILCPGEYMEFQLTYVGTPQLDDAYFALDFEGIWRDWCIKIENVESDYVSFDKAKVYFLDGIELDHTFTATVDWAGHTPGVVKFITPKGEFEGTGSGSVWQYTFDMGSDFGENGLLTVVAETASDPPVRSGPRVANLKVIPLPPGLPTEEWSIPASNQLKYVQASQEVTLPMEGVGAGAIPDWMPVFGSEPYEVTIGFKLSPEVLGDGTATAGAGTLGTGGSAASKFGGGDWNFNVGGKATWKYDGTEWKPGGSLEAGLSASKNLPPTPKYYVVWVWVIPIPVYWQGKVGAELLASIAVTGWNEDPFLPDLEGTYTVKPKAGVRAGVGVADVAAFEGNLAGYAPLVLQYPAEPTLKSVSIGFSGSLKLVVWVYTREWPILDYKWDLYTGGTDPLAGSLLRGGIGGSEFTLLPRDHLVPGYAKFYPQGLPSSVGRGSPRSVESVLQSDIFPYPSPSLVAIGNEGRLVWVYDDPERSTVNGTELMFSASTNGLWSPPVVVADDGTADFSPSLTALPNGDLLAAWENVDSALPEDSDLETMAAHMDVAAARFDEAAQTWSSQINLTSNGYLDRSPQVSAAANGQALLTWVSNAANNPIGSATEVNTVHYCLWNGSSWSAPGVVAAGVASIVKSAMAFDGSNALYLYSADMDGDLETTGDMELYAIAFDGATWSAPQRLTNEPDILDDNPQVVATGPGQFLFAWFRGGEIVTAGSLDLTDLVVAASPGLNGGAMDFRLTRGDSGQVVLVWQMTSQEAVDIWQALYDAGLNVWSKPVQLTFDDTMERFMSPAYLASGDLLIAYGKQQVSYTTRTLEIGGEEFVVDDVPVPGASDLCVLRHTAGIDLAVTADNVTITPGNPVGGETVAITATVRSVGDSPTVNVEVGFYDGDPGAGGTLLGSIQTIAGPLVGGDEAEAGVEWEVPASTDPRDIYVVVDPNQVQNDGDRTNNTAVAAVMRPDIAIEEIVVEKPKPFDRLLTLRVVNLSGVEVSNFDVVLRRDAVDGEVLATLPVAGPIAAGGHEDVSWLWEAAAPFAGGSVEVFAVADEADAVTEFDEDNNGRSVILANEDPVFDCNLNGHDDASDILNGTSRDCNSNGIPDECDIADGISPDCNTNGIPDECDIAAGTSEDINTDGIPDECTGACCNPDDGSCTETSLGECLAAGGMFQGVGTECATTTCPFGRYSNEIDPAELLWAPGAGLAVADDMRLAGSGARELVYYDLMVNGGGGGSFDVTAELWTDCPGWGGTLIPGTTTTWVNVPDAQVVLLTHEPDQVTIPTTVWMVVTFSTDQAGWIRADEAETGFTDDIFGHSGPPWVCNYWFGEGSHAGFWANLRCIAPDCNENGISDSSDIALGNSQDCNLNSIPDECDIAAGTSEDTDGDGVPDECAALGACCNSDDGSCVELPLDDCLASGGMFQGVGTECATITCPFGRYSNEVDPVETLWSPGAGRALADDITLAGTGARELVYYDLMVNGGGGGSFNVTAELWTNCPGWGGTLIPGTTATWSNVPDMQLVTLNYEPDRVVIPSVVWMVVTFSTDQAGWIRAGEAETGLTYDRFGQNDPPWVCNYSFGGDPYAGFWANLRCLAPDCNDNSVSDSFDITAGTSEDCQPNGIPDECDIADGASSDVNGNDVPDDCEPDCNGNSIPDSYDIAMGTSVDCNSNSIPDECDIAAGTSEDYDLNDVPDECDPDCNGNGVPDACDIDCNVGYCIGHPLGCGGSTDCQPNGIPDECDITAGSSGDCQPNGIPDECDIAAGGNFIIIDLGHLGLGWSWGYGVNESRQATGYSHWIGEAGNAFRAFRWTPGGGGMVHLGTLPDGTYSYGWDINNAGVVVGGSDFDNNAGFHACLWGVGGGMTDLGTLPGGGYTEAFGINDLGQVVGHGDTGSVANSAFLWQNGTMTNLGTLPGYGGSYAYRINNHAQVVGYSGNAFLWDSINGMQDLGSLGEAGSEAFDINNLGQVVGISWTWSGEEHAFLWDCINGMQDLGTLGGTWGAAYGINDFGHVVGASNTGGAIPEKQRSSKHAFLWQGGAMVDLNDHLVPGCEWELKEARDINNAGAIVGIGEAPDHRDHAFLAVRTSEDSNHNGIPDECEVSNDCNGNGIEDAQDIAVGTSQDCQPNGIPDECDVLAGSSQDRQPNGIPDECELDCNGNGVPDDYDIVVGTSEDCQPNGIPDECDIAGGTSQDTDGDGIPDECQSGPDCNGNGIDDAQDIAAGTSQDCQPNGIPDECDIAGGTSEDCQTNGIPDECEIAAGSSQDCQPNGIPDECEIAAGSSQDCQPNGIPDECDFASGTSHDCQPNGVPDECDIAAGSSRDCQSNGIPDECDLASGTSEDCQPNGIPDKCDIIAGTSQDCNGNWIPDECDPAANTAIIDWVRVDDLGNLPDIRYDAYG